MTTIKTTNGNLYRSEKSCWNDDLLVLYAPVECLHKPRRKISEAASSAPVVTEWVEIAVDGMEFEKFSLPAYNIEWIAT